MNFLEAFDELNLLNEKILTEKTWITINPKGSKNYYKFYTVNNRNNWDADIAQMLSPKIGTYKQSLNHQYVDQLKKELNSIPGTDSEKYEILERSGKTCPEEDECKQRGFSVFKLTKTDRELRKVAAGAVAKTIDSEATGKLKQEIARKRYLVHHIDGYEDNNSPQNTALVLYNEQNRDELKIAHGLHSILHMENAAILNTPNIKLDTTILYPKDGGWLKGTCTINIDWSKII